MGRRGPIAHSGYGLPTGRPPNRVLKNGLE